MLRKCIIVLVLGLLIAAPASSRKYKDEDTMLVSPAMFVLEYSGTRLSIHTEVPALDVDRTILELYGVGDIPITPVYVKRDNRGNLVVKFAADDVRTIVAPPRTELTLTGLYEDGGSFSLTATIRVR